MALYFPKILAKVYRMSMKRSVFLLAGTMVLVSCGGDGIGETVKGGKAPSGSDSRQVVFVANAEGGTVSLVDATSLTVIRELDVLPDGPDATPGEDDPVQGVIGQQITEAAGGDNFAQDQDISPDGRVLYVSRGHRGDVAAFELQSGDMLWKTSIPGFRSDHMTISEDGEWLYVSALTDNSIQILAAATGEITGTLPSGEWPHDNHISHDGQRLYNGSIGNIIVPREERDNRPDPLKLVLGVPYQLTVLDLATSEIVASHEFEAGVRPFVLTADERRVYMQHSFYHGLVEFDLVSGEITRTLDLPIDDGVTEDDYSFEAPHHGLAMSEDELLLCVAGRASDYVALVSTDSFEPVAIIDVGDAPSWSLTVGGHCYVANTGDDTLSVISYALGTEVARLNVGDGPKQLETGRVPIDAACGRSGPESGWAC